ncbi:MAG TPA: HAD-IA family hydrolase [archaeon]|nr:HAD-IA family hydrolase [archaeon]
MIKSIVFDFNGVFAKAIELRLVDRICAIKGFGKWIALSNYYLNIAQFELGFFSPQDFWKKIFPSISREEYLAYVEGEYERRFPRNEELYTICAGLSKKYALYCISNSNFLQGKAMRKQKLYSPFREVFLSHETGKIKPFPDAYLNFLEKTGLKANECIYVDDSLRNVLPAMALGFAGIKFENNEQLKAKFKELGISF